VPSPLPLETVTIELHNHISYEDTRVLSVLGVVPANQLRFVWQLPEVVPIEWETKQLILKVYKSMTTTVNNDPANRFWPFFTVVCATPVISITQPARVNCGEVVTVSWTYLFPEKNLWKPTDQLTLEIYSYLPLGIDPCTAEAHRLAFRMARRRIATLFLPPFPTHGRLPTARTASTLSSQRPAIASRRRIAFASSVRIRF
jgi:hypothetical protein